MVTAKLSSVRNRLQLLRTFTYARRTTQPPPYRLTMNDDAVYRDRRVFVRVHFARQHNRI